MSDDGCWRPISVDHLVVSDNGAIKVELELDHSKLGVYVVKLRFPKARCPFKCRTEVEEIRKS